MTSTEKDARIRELTNQVVELEKERDRLCDTSKYDDTAYQVFAMYQSFLNAGFEDVKAWELTKMMTEMAIANTKGVATLANGYIKK